MDRAELSEESIHEVGALFEAALREVAAELSGADLDGIERRLQAVGRQVLGPVVERVLTLRAAQEGMEQLAAPTLAAHLLTAKRHEYHLQRAGHPHRAPRCR